MKVSSFQNNLFIDSCAKIISYIKTWNLATMFIFAKWTFYQPQLKIYFSWKSVMTLSLNIATCASIEIAIFEVFQSQCIVYTPIIFLLTCLHIYSFAHFISFWTFKCINGSNFNIVFWIEFSASTRLKFQHFFVVCNIILIPTTTTSK